MEDNNIGKEFLNAKKTFEQGGFNIDLPDISNIPKKETKQINNSLRETNKNMTNVHRTLNTVHMLQLVVFTGALLGVAAFINAFRKVRLGGFGYGEEGEGGYFYGHFEGNDEKTRIKNKIIDEANRQGVDPAFALAVAETESHFDPKARSKVGAQGVFQLMPATAKSFGIDGFNEDQNIRVGVQILKGNLEKYGGDKQKALAAYNWGSGNLARKGIENAPKETKEHYAKIMQAEQKYNQLFSQMPNGSVPLATGKKFGGYQLRDKNVKISQEMAEYLKQTNGKGVVTSGVRGEGGITSHASGRKIDIGLGGQNDEKIIQTAVPFMRNPATVHVAFEGLGKKDDNASSVAISKRIVNTIMNRYPDIKKRIQLGDLKIYHWAWTLGGRDHHATGPHLDILMDPNKLSKNNSNLNTTNKNNVIANNNINKTNSINQNNKNDQNNPTLAMMNTNNGFSTSKISANKYPSIIDPKRIKQRQMNEETYFV